MNRWNSICSETNINELMDLYYGFHDTCMVSAEYISGDYVDEKNILHYGNWNNKNLRVIFHSQMVTTPLEMLFIGVRCFELRDWNNTYASDIYGATLRFEQSLFTGNSDTLILWANDEDFAVTNLNSVQKPPSIIIISSELKWRFREK